MKVLQRPIPIAIVAVGMACALLIVAGVSFKRSTPALVWGGGSESSGYEFDVRGAPYTYGDMNPCVTKGSVTVTRIAPTESAGITATGWGSRPNPFDHGVSSGAEDGGGKTSTIAQAGFRSGPRRVVNLCRDRTATGDRIADDLEFAVEIRRTGAATGWAHGLTVTYRSGGSTHTAQWPMNFVLCGNTKPNYPDRLMDSLCG